MTTWQQFAEQAPELAEAVRRRFDSETHHVLATLRKDGSPRVSGTEVQFHGPDLTMGSMWGALKARDLQRDPRCAVHAHPTEASMEGGDAKITARAIEVTAAGDLESYRVDEQPPPGDFHLFRLEPEQVVHTRVDNDRLLIRMWRPDEGVGEFHR